MKLGMWVSAQRKKKNALSVEQIERLNLLGFIWDALAEQWDQNFAALEKFKNRVGHCLVPTTHQEDGIKLGSWVAAQRKEKSALSAERIKRLNLLGFIWNIHAEKWDQNFAALENFHRRAGHCRVPKGHKEEGLNLGRWVDDQRRRKKGLTPNRLSRLNSLGFV